MTILIIEPLMKLALEEGRAELTLFCA